MSGHFLNKASKRQSSRPNFNTSMDQLASHDEQSGLIGQSSDRALLAENPQVHLFNSNLSTMALAQPASAKLTSGKLTAKSSKSKLVPYGNRPSNQVMNIITPGAMPYRPTSSEEKQRPRGAKKPTDSQSNRSLLVIPKDKTLVSSSLLEHLRSELQSLQKDIKASNLTKTKYKNLQKEH